MLDEKDLRIVSELRKDSRQKLKTISKATGIPISTVHERLHKMVGRGAVRLVSLPDYTRLRVPLVCWISLKAKDREAAKEWVLERPYTNTALQASNGADLLVECAFPSFKEQYAFLEAIKKHGRAKCYPVVEEVGREIAKIRKKN